MTVESRNEAWEGPYRYFVQVNGKTSSPRIWGITYVGNRIEYFWGQIGGALNTASENCTGVNDGKKNAVTPEAYARYRALDMLRKKLWEGYAECSDLSGSQLLDPPVVNKIDFDNLPLSLSFYKPDNTMSVGMLKKAEAGKVWYARKRNGIMYVLCRGSGEPQLYSRRMLRSNDNEQGTGLTWDYRFDHIIKAASRIMPPNSIFLGELVSDTGGVDNFSRIQSITKSLTDQSLREQGTDLPSYYIWDVAFWDGVDLVSNSIVSYRYELIKYLITNPAVYGPLLPVQYFTSDIVGGVDDAVEILKHQKWEGFVVVDPDGVYGEDAYNFSGKPKRPRAFCAKLKPSFEDDFIAIWNPDTLISNPPLCARDCDKNETVGERSKKGRYQNGIKSVALFQKDQLGNLIYISNVSSGLTEEMKINLAKPELFPRVWRVEFKDRRYVSNGDDTNALDFASFVEERTDKSVDECVNPEL